MREETVMKYEKVIKNYKSISQGSIRQIGKANDCTSLVINGMITHGLLVGLGNDVYKPSDKQTILNSSLANKSLIDKIINEVKEAVEESYKKTQAKKKEKLTKLSEVSVNDEPIETPVNGEPEDRVYTTRERLIEAERVGNKDLKVYLEILYPGTFVPDQITYKIKDEFLSGAGDVYKLQRITDIMVGLILVVENPKRKKGDGGEENRVGFVWHPVIQVNHMGRITEKEFEGFYSTIKTKFTLI